MERGDLLFRTDGGAWHLPQTTGYDSEAALQSMLAEEPALLPGVTDRARGVTEFSTRVGPSDVVVVDEHGLITVVECKLVSNEEARRKIVGQVFDYAARLWKLRRSEFQIRWEQRGGEPLESWLGDEALEELDRALQEGRFRLVLAVDRITEDLRRLVEYLNAHTQETVEVLALELNVAREGTVEVLIPTVYGTELVDTAGQTATTKRPVWSTDDVLEYLQEHTPQLVEPVTALVNGCERVGARVVGSRAATPSLTVAVDGPTGTMWPLNFYTGDEQHAVAINYDWVRRAGDAALEQFLLTTAAAVPEVDVDAVRGADYRKRPGLPAEYLLREGAVGALVAAVEHLARAAKTSGGNSREGK